MLPITSLTDTCQSCEPNLAVLGRARSGFTYNLDKILKSVVERTIARGNP